MTALVLMYEPVFSLQLKTNCIQLTRKIINFTQSVKNEINTPTTISDFWAADDLSVVGLTI